MKKSKAKRKHSTSILSRLLVPMLFVFVIQAAVMMSMFLSSDILKKSSDNAYGVLSEKVLNRKILIENEMSNRWTRISDLHEKVLKVIKTELSRNNIDLYQLANMPELQNRVLNTILPELIYTIRRNYVTGVFFVIDAPSPLVKTNAFFYPGLYVRNEEPSSYSSINDDLVISRGSSEVVQNHNIALGVDWSPFFTIVPNSHDVAYRYFNAPIAAAMKYPNEPAKNLAFWNTLSKLDPLSDDAITYSIPIKDDAGNIYGVLGIDLSAKYIQTFLGFDELDISKKGMYCMAVHDIHNDAGTFLPIVFSSIARNLNASHIPAFKVERSNYKNVYTIEEVSIFEEKYCLAIEPFHLYQRNGMYENQEWVLIGLAPEASLLSFSVTLKKIFWQSVLVSGFLFLAGSYLSSKHISNMFTKVVLKLQNSDPRKIVNIEKMNITEIDTLIVAIENLSASVFNAASRVSTIIEKLQVPIGVFEHNILMGTVFCNSIWFKLFNIQKYSGDSVLKTDEFYKLLDHYEYYINSKDDSKTIYAIPTGAHGMVRWIRFMQTKENDKILGIALDITKEVEDRKKLELQMNYDDLTGLYNRAAFDRKITEVFKQKHLGICALVMWDLDNLKYLNDSFGHAYGDTHLMSFGKKLAMLQQDRCLVCRRSGDEFYTFFYTFSTSDEIKLILTAFWKDIQETPIVLPNGENSRLRVSAGLAWYPYDADNQADLVRYADFAMYDVKHSFKGSLHEFNLDVYKKNYIMIHGTEALNQMLERNLIEYALQPIVTSGTGDIYGYEMLMRSFAPEFKSPEDILRLAKAQSKLHKLEELTFFGAMETFVKKIEKGEISKNTKIFLNTISSQVLSEAKFFEFEERFKPYLSNIVLEITESEPLNTNFYDLKNERIRNWNAMVAIDDFGSGYSNESSLLFLSPNLVKIDMSIVRDVHKSLDKQNVLENLVSYAKKRDIIILAEGVETIDEIDVLLRFGVDLFQGYFFAKPSFDIIPIPEERIQELNRIFSLY
ncbi:bifunctional diguanylate cyclase/phosphodiesterase [Treponema sp. OMZ 788]|uniref:EAL domain-containing protein n=1 Tax=Treponema sp. OMZ 788 TaxID=2563664 RepID=UPI0020A3C4FA|nr:bifunctional diguanylate cyclase/phosphodiesterase [Treponema sp. OMZ 788]UTC65169.1 bifunctional diguanylate cyclase/phosphodiesterase [Treponema sp. OMZ 788]